MPPAGGRDPTSPSIRRPTSQANWLFVGLDFAVGEKRAKPRGDSENDTNRFPFINKGKEKKKSRPSVRPHVRVLGRTTA